MVRENEMHDGFIVQNGLNQHRVAQLDFRAFYTCYPILQSILSYIAIFIFNIAIYTFLYRYIKNEYRYIHF